MGHVPLAVHEGSAEDGAPLFQDVLGNGGESAPRGALPQDLAVPVLDHIAVLFAGVAGVCMEDGADLFAQAALDAAIQVHFGIQKALPVGLHLNALFGAHIGAACAAAAVHLVLDVNHTLLLLSGRGFPASRLRALSIFIRCRRFGLSHGSYRPGTQPATAVRSHRQKLFPDRFHRCLSGRLPDSRPGRPPPPGRPPA